MGAKSEGGDRAVRHLCNAAFVGQGLDFRDPFERIRVGTALLQPNPGTNRPAAATRPETIQPTSGAQNVMSMRFRSLHVDAMVAVHCAIHTCPADSSGVAVRTQQPERRSVAARWLPQAFVIPGSCGPRTAPARPAPSSASSRPAAAQRRRFRRPSAGPRRRRRAPRPSARDASRCGLARARVSPHRRSGRRGSRACPPRGPAGGRAAAS